MIRLTLSLTTGDTPSEDIWFEAIGFGDDIDLNFKQLSAVCNDRGVHYKVEAEFEIICKDEIEELQLMEQLKTVPPKSFYASASYNWEDDDGSYSTEIDYGDFSMSFYKGDNGVVIVGNSNDR